jgi:DNA-binding transcriptional LysR family regulator
MRQLERTLGVALVETTSFGVRPTREAERLALQVRLALAEVAQARAEIAAEVGTGTGATVIGAMPLARSVLVPLALLEFAAEYPEHSLSILDGPYDSMLRALRCGAADVLIGAMREPAPTDDVVQEHLFDDPLTIIMRAHHPLAAKRAATVRELAGFPWIAPRAESPLRRQFDELFQNAGTRPPVAAIECNSLVAARAILLASDRLMLLSAHQIHYELVAGQLVALPHPHGHVVRSIGLTIRRDWRPTQVQSSLLDALRRHARTVARGHRQHGKSRRRRIPSAADRDP